MTTMTKNQILLEGIPLSAPELSHENHGTRFYRFLLEVPRLSGTPDVLPILLPESLRHQVSENIPIRIRGQLRSFNNRSGVGNKLVLTVYSQEFLPAQNESCNLVSLAGSLCKPPVFRRTPLGRSICDLMLAVPRHYGRADYLPVIAWGQLAIQASQLQIGESLDLEGRFQSRTYQKTLADGCLEQRTAYEVSMMHLFDNI